MDQKSKRVQVRGDDDVGALLMISESQPSSSTLCMDQTCGGGVVLPLSCDCVTSSKFGAAQQNQLAWFYILVRLRFESLGSRSLMRIMFTWSMYCRYSDV
jgi:hypothetical protein